MALWRNAGCFCGIASVTGTSVNGSQQSWQGCFLTCAAYQPRSRVGAAEQYQGGAPAPLGEGRSAAARKKL